jgi:hypothetical protein
MLLPQSLSYLINFTVPWLEFFNIVEIIKLILTLVKLQKSLDSIICFELQHNSPVHHNHKWKVTDLQTLTGTTGPV